MWPKISCLWIWHMGADKSIRETWQKQTLSMPNVKLHCGHFGYVIAKTCIKRPEVSHESIVALKSPHSLQTCGMAWYCKAHLYGKPSAPLSAFALPFKLQTWKPQCSWWSCAFVTSKVWLHILLGEVIFLVARQNTPEWQDSSKKLVSSSHGEIVGAPSSDCLRVSTQ